MMHLYLEKTLENKNAGYSSILVSRLDDRTENMYRRKTTKKPILKVSYIQKIRSQEKATNRSAIHILPLTKMRCEKRLQRALLPRHETNGRQRLVNAAHRRRHWED